ncbi:MAG: type II toxin-antitoxin system VapC family toxin [Pseudolysinimonas sp.]|uniref:type II toxin-antitoxin system VapC family toxin n=1 Tax=Pseudolysinimonas sp. TaxID=2680009 RepID=UPI003C74085A
MTVALGLLDTSVLIASEIGRSLDETALPEQVAVSVITIAELHAGVHAARDADIRSRRMATLDSVAGLVPLPVDASAAKEWARLRFRLAENGRGINVNDLWIASIAVARGIPVVTQDDDFAVLAGLGGPDVIKV